MPSIFDIIQSQLGEGQLEQIAKQIGADKSKTRDAIAMTLPTMIEALARQADKPGGIDKIHSQLNNTPSSGTGSMLDQLGQVLNQGAASHSSSSPISSIGSSFANEILPPGMSAPVSRTSQAPSHAPASAPASGLNPMDIFSQILGGSQSKVADSVSKTSGIGAAQAGSLIAILGPLLASTLAQQTKSGKISSQDLDGMLKQDRARVQQSPGGSMIGKMLDQDGDGDFDISDMMKLGMSMLFRK